MGISSRLKMIKNYIGWRKENKEILHRFLQLETAIKSK